MNLNEIVFNSGLSVVLGTNTGDNSIGKSTFLLIVDFVFGGGIGRDLGISIDMNQEYVCEKIKASFENTPLPDADRKATKGELLEKWLMRIPAIIYLAFWGLFGVGVWLTYREDFVFPRYYTNPINYIGTAYILIPVLAAIIVLFLYRKCKSFL